MNKNETSRHVPSGDRPILRDILRTVNNQIEINCFETEYLACAHELALIITEVYMLKHDSVMHCAGSELSVDMVQQVFNELTHEHIAVVIENYMKVNHEIKCKKSYLRTALYNSVFELEAHILNETRDLR